MITIGAWEATVLDVDGRTISQVRLRRLDAAHPDGNGGDDPI